MKKTASDQVCRDEVSQLKQKYQNLLEDYLDLQKDFVSRKKKLEAADRKRRLLAGEVRFLRRRYAYLLSLQSTDSEAKGVQIANADLCDKQIDNERNRHVSENDVWITCTDDAKEFRSGAALKMGKKLQNCSVNGKTPGKRKFSWQDPPASGV